MHAPECLPHACVRLPSVVLGKVGIVKNEQTKLLEGGKVFTWSIRRLHQGSGTSLTECKDVHTYTEMWTDYTSQLYISFILRHLAISLIFTIYVLVWVQRDQTPWSCDNWKGGALPLNTQLKILISLNTTKHVLQIMIHTRTKMIGASLSKPHTSGTACADVCVYNRACGHIP